MEFTFDESDPNSNKIFQTVKEKEKADKKKKRLLKKMENLGFDVVDTPDGIDAVYPANKRK